MSSMFPVVRDVAKSAITDYMDSHYHLSWNEDECPEKYHVNLPSLG
jgi:hypothetical protein